MKDPGHNRRPSYSAYDPTTGRFTQEDPIGLAGGLNLYGFAGGDPVTFSDPFGLCPLCQPGVVIPAALWLAGALGVRGTADVAVSTVPFVSTIHDATTLITGHNYVTNEDGGRIAAAIGLVTPAGGGQIRGLLTAAKHVLSEGTQRVAAELSDRALRKAYHGAIDQINRHKEILSRASPEQVNSITVDIVKHEKRLQAAIEEMQRRGIAIEPR